MIPPDFPRDGSPRIGVWGTFDLENYGDLLFPRIAESELLHRLPRASVRAFAPYGFRHPLRLDPSRRAEPLGAWSSERAGELAEELDLVLVGGGEIIHTKDALLAQHYGVHEDELRKRAPSRFFIEGLGPALERTCPVVWHAVGIPMDLMPEEANRVRAALAGRPYVSVRGETSRRRLVESGVDREIVVVPDPAFLVTRLFPPDLLTGRVEHLRALGWYPRDRGALVLQGSRSMLAWIPDLAERVDRLLDRRRDLAPVLIGTGPSHGDHEFAEALSNTLTQTTYRIPEGVMLEDLVAAIWGARVFVGISLHGNITACCFDVPHVALDLLGYSKLDDFGRTVENPSCVVSDLARLEDAVGEAERVRSRPEVLARLQARVDGHFDRIAGLGAEMAEARSGARTHASEKGIDGRADEVPDRKRVEERFHFAEALAAACAREAELGEHVARLEAEIGALKDQLDVLYHSRSLRLTAPLRALRHRLGVTRRG